MFNEIKKQKKIKQNQTLYLLLFHSLSLMSKKNDSSLSSTK